MSRIGLCIVSLTCFVSIFGVQGIEGVDTKTASFEKSNDSKTPLLEQPNDTKDVLFEESNDSIEDLNNTKTASSEESNDTKTTSFEHSNNTGVDPVEDNSLQSDFPKTMVSQEDASLTVPEMIEKYGYPVEVHHLHTEDGYILEIHRIPHGVAKDAGPSPDKPVVIVQHGLLCSSADWIITGPKKGLGYLLADLGYDVWLGNARGNKYSRKHESLSPNQGEFWDFSWHEIGIYDLPTMIDYVLKETNQEKTYYIGHSQGTTAFYVMCSMKPEYNDKIKAMFSLAPIAYMYHMTSPMLKIISKFEGNLDVVEKLFGIHEFLPSTKLLTMVGGVFCSKSSLIQFVCTNYLFVLCGFSEEQMNYELFPVIMGHTPAGASSRQLIHYAQNINHKNEFRQYDFGLATNMLKYNNVKPPSYNITKITAPVALLYSQNDWLAAEVDVLRLHKELANPIECFLIPDQKFNHLDFLWGRDADTLVYNKVFSLMTNK